jgi:hypothetical protein
MSDRYEIKDEYGRTIGYAERKLSPFEQGQRAGETIAGGAILLLLLWPLIKWLFIGGAYVLLVYSAFESGIRAAHESLLVGIGALLIILLFHFLVILQVIMYIQNKREIKLFGTRYRRTFRDWKELLSALPLLVLLESCAAGFLIELWR